MEFDGHFPVSEHFPRQIRVKICQGHFIEWPEYFVKRQSDGLSLNQNVITILKQALDGLIFHQNVIKPFKQLCTGQGWNGDTVHHPRE